MPPKPTLVCAFLLITFVCDSTSAAEDIDEYWLVVEYSVPVLMRGVMRKRGET